MPNVFDYWIDHKIYELPISQIVELHNPLRKIDEQSVIECPVNGSLKPSGSHVYNISKFPSNLNLEILKAAAANVPTELQISKILKDVDQFPMESAFQVRSSELAL